MGATAALKRGLLRSAKSAADAGSIPLSTALIALEAAKLTDAASGKVLTGTASSGRSVAFSLPPMTDATPQDIHAGADYLLLLYDETFADGGATDDASVYARMMRAIKPVRFFGDNFVGVTK